VVKGELGGVELHFPRIGTVAIERVVKDREA